MHLVHLDVWSLTACLGGAVFRNEVNPQLEVFQYTSLDVC